LSKKGQSKSGQSNANKSSRDTEEELKAIVAKDWYERSYQFYVDPYGWVSVEEAGHFSDYADSCK